MPIITPESPKKRAVIDFLEGLNLLIKTDTKARGHQGIYFKNRIDVSKHLDEEKAVRVLVHEFAHFIHGKLEDSIYRDGGSLNAIFSVDEIDVYYQELLKVTDFIDKNSRMVTLKKFNKEVKESIKELQTSIQRYYPSFLRSKRFKEFDKYIKKSNARYLLKYDRVTIVTPFLGHKTVIDVDLLARDFDDMPQAFADYIRLKSRQRKLARISRRINKYKKYYTRPTELFARFVEGMFFERDFVEKIAPQASVRFIYLLNENYYFELKDFFEKFSYIN
ncbi:MAG: hypothetical protein PHV37_01235 [Candidatus Gastranaerophilales bacterium]|nr:hypothetical protein [Candidatus Gastranaerophilales bacterium]